VAERFAGAESLDTLRLIFAPFAPNSSELLANLLQIVALAGAGAAAGWLAGWGRTRLVLNDLDETPTAVRWLARRFTWTGLLPAGVAALVLGAVLLLIPYAVGRPLSALALQEAGNLLGSKLVLGFTATLAVLGSILLAQPLPSSTAKPRQRAAKAADPAVLPPLDLAPVKAGRYVPAWAAQAGLADPLPPDPEAAADEAALGFDGMPDDLVDLLMQTATPAPFAGPEASVTEMPAFATQPPAPRSVAPPARDIAIELD
jgi:hypothetical protein